MFGVSILLNIIFMVAAYVFSVEMAAMGLNSQFIQNPFLQNLSSLLYNQNAPQWGSQLSNKAVASMWMNNDAKQLHQHEEEEVCRKSLRNQLEIKFFFQL